MNTRVQWNDAFYFKAYQFAREGMRNGRIARSLGVRMSVFYHWIKTKPALSKALEEARAVKYDRTSSVSVRVQSFEDYVYRRLPPHLQKIWGKVREPVSDDEAVVALDDKTFDGKTDRRPSRKVMAARMWGFLDGLGEQDRQRMLLHVIVYCNYNIHDALWVAGVTWKEFTRWKDDKNFVELLIYLHETKKSFFEECLYKAAKEGDVAAIKFGLESLASDRGYSRKASVDVNLKGQVNHDHSIDLSKLSIEARKEMLAQIESGEVIEGEVVEG